MGGVQYVEPEISQASRVEIDDFLELLQCEASRGHFTGLKSNTMVTQYASELQSANDALSSGKPAMVMTYAIKAQGQAIGLCVLRAIEDPTILDLNVLLISPNWRNRGFGRWVINTFREEMKNSGRRLQVRCMPASISMMSLLVPMGFREIPQSFGSVRYFSCS
ncbi:GNAT family N-acetyltransferase [Pseudomonas amygdali]|uniref:GNAT family N-acetyltransferase n=1 Tax=Pseudomonas amygdali TaxID=47877 RepID=UPI00076023F3|nr:GNAT family N-acetyltransferase [Pseudomonas amygdali]AVB13122.1 N-acetyltransferase [Pseudomonas amygdali pv. morsprunorum]KWS61495.1 GCN5 family acetyltransferase [Pseudomonas amygdali pv. morsprunorum]POP88393.1 N-acetyltransferase [Pseudomonas amygdali pv. morsprunorum]